MQVTISPSRACGQMEAPPSKSMAHRLLICAGLAEGSSVISNVDFSRDILATLDCLRALGAEIVCENRKVIIRGTDICKKETGVTDVCGFESGSPEQGQQQKQRKQEQGQQEQEHQQKQGKQEQGQQGKEQQKEAAVLDCGECGSTLRFMIPVCLMSAVKRSLTGSHTLFTRPLTVYEKICEEQKLTYIKEGNHLTVAGKLSSGEYLVPGNISSQFISGLLFVLPLLEEDSTIRLIPPVESRPYIDMTLQALKEFGVTADWAYSENTAPCIIRIAGRQKYTPRKELQVEGDYSNAAFFEALNLLGGDVRMEGLDENSLQGDQIYRRYFKELSEGYAQVDLSDCPDLGPVLMAAAAAQHGACFTGTKRLKIKESDRGAAMQQELAKMNVDVQVSENEIRIRPGMDSPKEILDGHNDHRIVMALSVLLTRTGGSIRGAQAVSKSLPDFFERLKKLGIGVTIDELDQ